VFQADLEGMDEERRTAALAARAAAQKAQAAGENSRSGQGGAGLAGLLAPRTGGRMRPPGGSGTGRASGGGFGGGGFGASGGQRGNSAGPGRGETRLGTLWFMGENGKPACLRVRAGISDGSFTEVQALGPGELEGREIILRERI
jgi:hypothetical protein